MKHSFIIKYFEKDKNKEIIEFARFFKKFRSEKRGLKEYLSAIEIYMNILICSFIKYFQTSFSDVNIEEVIVEYMSI